MLCFAWRHIMQCLAAAWCPCCFSVPPPSQTVDNSALSSHVLTSCLPADVFDAAVPPAASWFTRPTHQHPSRSTQVCLPRWQAAPLVCWGWAATHAAPATGGL